MDRYHWKKSLAAMPVAARHKFIQSTPLWVPAAVLSSETKSIDGELENVEVDSGPVWFRVTDSGIDREGDIILSAGMDIETYSAHGSLIWGHDASVPERVIGKPVEVVRGDSSIDVAFEFASDINPVAAMVEKYVKQGFVKGVSVGIYVREYTEANDRGGFMPVNIIRSELIEISITPIPANPRAMKLEDDIAAMPANEPVGAVATNEEPYERVTRPPVDPVTAVFLKALRKDQ